MNFKVKTNKQDLIFVHAHILTINPYACLIWEQKYIKEAKIHPIINFLLFRGIHTTEAGLEHVVNLVKYISKADINRRELFFSGSS